MKVLFLDDERSPQDVTWVRYPSGSVFTVVRCFNDFQEAVRLNDTFDAWSLDHDLGCNEFQQPYLTGYDSLKTALRWHPEKAPSQVVAHSQNPIGKRNIIEYWRNYVSNRD